MGGKTMQYHHLLTAAAKLLQSCPTLCDPIDSSPPGSPVPGILQAKTLEWVAISFSNAWKWKVKVKSLSCVRLLATPWTAAHQAPLSMGFARQEYWLGGWNSVQFSLVAQSCLIICDHMDCSMPGLPVHHQLPEFTRTHFHWVGDAIQTSHPLWSLSSPTFNVSQHQSPFQWVSSSHWVAKVLEFQLQHKSFQCIFRNDFLQDGLVGSPCCPRDSQESFPTPQFKSISSLVLNFLYSPTLTYIHDYLKNHSFV